MHGPCSLQGLSVVESGREGPRCRLQVRPGRDLGAAPGGWEKPCPMACGGFSTHSPGWEPAALWPTLAAAAGSQDPRDFRLGRTSHVAQSLQDQP